MSYEASVAEVSERDISPVSLIAHMPVEMIKTLLYRIGLEYEEGLMKDAYAGALYEQLTSDVSLILYLMSEDALEFLLEIWEKDRITELDDYRWNLLDQLRAFGLVAYRKSNILSDQPNMIYVIPSMKDQFYFQLRSRKSRKLISTYYQWERVLLGFMYYYGIIELENLYQCFCQIMGDTDYEEFVRFLYCRITLWPILMIADSGSDGKFCSLMDIENPHILRLYKEEHKNLDYKLVSKEDLLIISESGGIDNRWAGISQLGTILIEKAELSYYRATVLVRSLLQLIQNGKEISKLYEQMETVLYNKPELVPETKSAIESLYYAVPIFEYKGYNRREFDKFDYINQLKKKRKQFTIVYNKRD